MPQESNRPGAGIRVEPAGDGRLRVTVEKAGDRGPVSGESSLTRYPAELIDKVLEAKGAGHLCDEIRRDEDPRYVRAIMDLGVFAYVPEDFYGPGTRLLDFGCGSAASCLHLARFFPEAEILGVDMAAPLLDLARARAGHYGLEHLRFLESPDAESLPEGIGQFDAVFLNALYEHLLPAERRGLLPLIWRAVKPGGLLFVTETPNRPFPIERHTTGLPLLNYLPDALAHRVALRFCGRLEGDESWEGLLRRGIRGGSVRELMGILDGAGEGRSELLEPSRRGLGDRIDLWVALSLAMSGAEKAGAAKRAAAAAMKGIKALTGAALVPELSLAIRKRSRV